MSINPQLSFGNFRPVPPGSSKAISGYVPPAYNTTADGLAFKTTEQLYRFMTHLQRQNSHEVSGIVEPGRSDIWFNFKVSDSITSAKQISSRMPDACSWHSHPSSIPEEIFSKDIYPEAGYSAEIQEQIHLLQLISRRSEEVSMDKPSSGDLLCFATEMHKLDYISLPNNKLLILSVKDSLPNSPIRQFGYRCSEHLRAVDEVMSFQPELAVDRQYIQELKIGLELQCAIEFESILRKIKMTQMTVENWPKVLTMLGLPFKLLDISM